MIIKIPLEPYPNQTFTCTVPSNNKNIDLRFKLWYSYVSNTWYMSIFDNSDGRELITNTPLIYSNGQYLDLYFQYKYKNLGSCAIIPIEKTDSCRPDNTNLGKTYYLIWNG